MKETGIVRKIDALGRIVIPKELRRTLVLEHGTEVEILVDADEGVILRKYIRTCPLCLQEKAHKSLIPYNEVMICEDCARKLRG